jgi:L-threonylcarbamoyladenylate synthase
MLRLPFADERDLAAALKAVLKARQGHGGVALPTETVYGLAVPPDDPVAVARVFTLKGRPAEKALPVVAASVEQLDPMVVFPEAWRRRLQAAWPAPLTVVLPSRTERAGGGNVAVRIPAHPLLRALLASVGPLTATSANRSGGPPLSRPRDVARLLGAGLALLLDGGEAPGGLPSTVVDLSGELPRLLRPGPWQVPSEWGIKGV